MALLTTVETFIRGLDRGATILDQGIGLSENSGVNSGGGHVTKSLGRSTGIRDASGGRPAVEISLIAVFLRSKGTNVTVSELLRRHILLSRVLGEVANFLESVIKGGLDDSEIVTIVFVVSTTSFKKGIQHV